MGYISKIQIGSGTALDVRDAESMHYQGKVNSTLHDGDAAGSSYKENDVVNDSNNDLFIAKNVSSTLTWKKLTPDALTIPVVDVKIDGQSILGGEYDDQALIWTTGLSGTPYHEDNNPLTTKAYVDDAISEAVEELPQAMIFRGTLGQGGTITALPTASASTVGDVYKVVTKGTYATKAAEVGDLFICAQGGTAQSPTYSWELIPSGDVPSGTVTSVGAGVGLTVDDNDDNPIINAGTIKVNIASETAFADGTIHNVGVKSNGNLAVRVLSDTSHPYSEATGSENPYATVSTVTSAIDALDLGTAISNTAGKTISTITESNGIVGATFQDISITNSQISDITRNGDIWGYSSSTDLVDGVSTTSTSGAESVGALATYTEAQELLTINTLYQHKTSTSKHLEKILLDAAMS